MLKTKFLMVILTGSYTQFIFGGTKFGIECLLTLLLNFVYCRRQALLFLPGVLIFSSGSVLADAIGQKTAGNPT